jgi:hypothetical protein
VADVHATKITTLYAGLVVALLAMSASAKLENLDARWSDYAKQMDSFEPAYTFPHSTCFKAAALQYDLPETPARVT